MNRRDFMKLIFASLLALVGDHFIKQQPNGYWPTGHLSDEMLDDLRAGRRAAEIYEDWKHNPGTARPIEDVEADLIAKGQMGVDKAVSNGKDSTFWQSLHKIKLEAYPTIFQSREANNNDNEGGFVVPLKFQKEILATAKILERVDRTTTIPWLREILYKTCYLKYRVGCIFTQKGI